MASRDRVSSKELLEAQSHLWNHIFSFINSLFEVHRRARHPWCRTQPRQAHHSHWICLSCIHSWCRIPNFQRFMRLLVHNGFFNQLSTDPNEDIRAQNKSHSPYKEDGHVHHAIHRAHPRWVTAGSLAITEFMVQEEHPSMTFEVFHGIFIWEATGMM